MSILTKEQRSVPHKPHVAVVVETEDAHLINEAKQLRAKFREATEKPSLLLYFGHGGIDIRSAKNPTKKGYFVDFSAIDRRTGAGNLSRKQIFPKSIGSSTKTIIDATAGFGSDAAMLALMGYTVKAFERSPIIAVLLRDGLRRAKQNQEINKALGGRLSFTESDSLDAIQTTHPADVVYLDPMFPPKRKKTALPQGSVQLLQAIVGHDNKEQTKSLFELALRVAKKRVVVKRPNHAKLFRDNPAAVHKGKLVRYEVYKPV